MMARTKAQMPIQTSRPTTFISVKAKVVGRDVWIGIWAFVLAIIATTYWERGQPGARPDARQIWWRFPKFVLGFLAASILLTAVTTRYSLADYDKQVVPGLVALPMNLRTGACIFCVFVI